MSALSFREAMRDLVDAEAREVIRLSHLPTDYSDQKFYEAIARRDLTVKIAIMAHEHKIYGE